jgi:predicted nucleic acid-binding protein
MRLARTHRLIVYDAAYLKVARAEAVPLIGPESAS